MKTKKIIIFKRNRLFQPLPKNIGGSGLLYIGGAKVKPCLKK